jgi:multiple sugar transport system substrate-binding protein
MSDQIGAISRRNLLRLSMAAAGAGFLAGCDVGGGDSKSGGEGSGEGKITALFMQQAAYSEDDVRKMTADFQAANPKVKVEPTFVAYEALHDKIVAAAPAGTYDVVLIDVIWPAEFSTKKIVTEVSGEVPGAWKSDMLPGALTTAKYQDKYYGVPWILDTKYLFSNTEHLQKAGVDPASLSTWDGVLAAAKAIKDKGVTEYPLLWSWKQAEAIVCDYTQLVGAFGGKFLSDDGKSVAFNSGGGVKALEFMKKTLDDKLTNPASLESLEDDVRKTFVQGGASLALNWTYMYAATDDTKESKVSGKVNVQQTPSGGSGQPGCNGSMALCVTSGSKNQKAAWQYISYLTSADNQNKYAKNSLPCWSASYEDAKVIETSPKVVPVAKKALASLIERPQVPRYNDISQLLQAELQNALLGKKSPQQALDDAAKQAKSLVA